MGVKKIYKSTTGIQYGFVITLKRLGKTISTSVSLSNDLTLEVLFPDIQEAVENTSYFKNKQIVIAYEMELTESDIEKLDSVKKAEEHNALKELDVKGKENNSKALKDSKIEGLKDPSLSILGLENKNVTEGIDNLEEGRNNNGIPEAADYPDVTNINEAVEILKSNPYNIHHMKLRTPEAIKNQAKLNNISFSNLKLE